MLDVLKSFITKSKLTENIQFDLTKIKVSDNLKSKINKLGKKSFSIREIDAGSSNDCENEIAALEGPVYDIQRFGIKLVASPRHADILLVTGPVTPGMELALIKAYEATPEPKIVIALGDGAITGKICKSISGKNLKKVNECIPVDLEIVGNPPSPEDILVQILGVINNA